MSNLVSSPKNVVYVNGGQTYNVSAADDVININTTLGATEIVLPNIVNQGLDYYPKKFTVNDTGGAAGTNPITISAVGNQVNSAASTILNRNNVSSEIVIVSKTEYLVNTDNGGSTGIFGSGTVGQLAYFSASTVIGSLTNTQVTALLNVFTGDSGAGGIKGLVPAPASGDASKFLRGDGTWASAAAGSGTINTVAKFTTTSTVGNSNITDDGTYVSISTSVGIGIATPTAKLQIDGTTATQAVSSFLVRNSLGGELIKLLNDGSALIGINTFAVTNTNMFNNSVNFYINGTTLKGIYKDNSGNDYPLIIPNLENTNLVSTDNARTFTLKTGGTSSQYLGILNDGGGSLLRLAGNNRILMLTSTDSGGDISIGDGSNTKQVYTYGSITLYPATGGDYTTTVAGTTGVVNVDRISSGAYAKIEGNPGDPYFKVKAAENVLAGLNASNQQIHRMDNRGFTQIFDTSGTEQVWLSSQTYYNFLGRNTRIGGSYGTPTAKFEVIGSGSTSATITALFQNSSASASLTIKDDLTSLFGGAVTAPQVINTPFAVSVSTNAGTVTRSYRNNNFTNSSAATMTITLSTTGAVDGDEVKVRIYDASAVAQTITWVNTENSTITVPPTSNGSTTLPLTAGFQYNGATSKWRCIGYA